MTSNMQKELFSIAYIRAVTAVSGYQVNRPELDFDSVDGVLASSERRRARIEFQAKATSRDVLKGENIRFPLKMKNYDDLRPPVDEITVPRILIVVLVPQEPEDWLTQTHDELCLRHCGYWLSLEGRPEVPNTNTITVSIPTSNIFDSSQLRDLMTKAGDGRPLC